VEAAIHVEGERISKGVIGGNINICDGEGEVSGGRGKDSGEREAARDGRGEGQDVGLPSYDQPSAAAISEAPVWLSTSCCLLLLLILFTAPSVLKYKMF
jgi:hypothetical protein